MKQHIKIEVLEEFKIPLTDINQAPYTLGCIALNFDRQKFDKKIINNENPHILLTVQQQRSFLSNFVPPALNYIEDSPLPDKASMHDLKIAFKRLKRVRILYIKLVKSIYQTFFWIYPEFSKLAMGLYCIIVLFLPGNLFLPLFFLCVLVFCALMNPKNSTILKKLNKMFFCKSKHVQPVPRIITIKQAAHLRKSRIEILKEKNQDGVINRWKKFKEDAVELQNYMMLLACYGEKIRHLFLWEDPEKSYFFCIGLILLIIFLICVPFRLVLLIVGLHRFYKGYKFTKKRIYNNRKVCIDVLNSLFQQYLPDLFIKADSNNLWSNQFKDNIGAQKKIIEGISSKLSLEVDPQVFEKYNSPVEVTNYISSAQLILKHKDNKGEHVYDFNSEKSTNLLLGFLINIPSEYYRLEHPRLNCVEVY
jgi:hypothetical protein